MIDRVAGILATARSSLEKRMAGCESEIKKNIEKYLSSEDSMFGEVIDEFNNIKAMQEELLKSPEENLKEWEAMREEFLQEATSGTADFESIQNEYSPIDVDITQESILGEAEEIWKKLENEDLNLTEIFGGDQNG